MHREKLAHSEKGYSQRLGGPKLIPSLIPLWGHILGPHGPLGSQMCFVGPALEKKESSV